MTRPTLITLFATLALLAGSAYAGERTLTTFDGKDSLRWQTVNDGVMGGRSRGDSDLSQDGTLRFAGRISLENNGGFSSIRTRPQDLTLSGYDGIEIRVRGDGRVYKLALRTNSASRWIAYWADFPTKNGEWTTVRIPFSKWAPYTFGRRLPGPKLVPSAVNSIGFMLYDKKSGPFSLEVDSIRAYQGEAKAEESTAGGTPTIVEAARSAGTFRTLLAAAKAAGLVEALSGSGTLTVFAPSDAAFAKLPKGTVEKLLEPGNRDQLRTILLHHVVKGDVSLPALLRSPKPTSLAGQPLEILRDGSAVRVGPATVVTAGLRCSNGVIHVVDQVILPELRDLATIAVEAKTFQTLVTAVKAAGLVDALTGDADLTVFAPSDAAFAKLPEGTVERLLRPENRDALKRLLLHHVVKGRVYADAAAAAGNATTLAGTRLAFDYAGGLRVAGTGILMPDITARNGVIHVVDDVLLPPPVESGPAQATRLITRAIEEGVGLFNGGDAEGCCKVYERAVTALLELEEDTFTAAVRKKLESALDSTESARDRAWTLRRAMDAAWAEADRSAR